VNSFLAVYLAGVVVLFAFSCKRIRADKDPRVAAMGTLEKNFFYVVLVLAQLLWSFTSWWGIGTLIAEMFTGMEKSNEL